MARPTKEESKIVEERNALICSLKREGKRVTDIARLLNLPKGNVSKIIKKKCLPK